MKKCIFAGTFDPPTLGHRDTVRQAAAAFDETVVALLVNPSKQPFFTLEERLDMLRLLCQDIPGVRFVCWQGAVVDLLRREDTVFYVRGIRNTVDLEYENANFYANRKLYKDIITLYFPAAQEHIHISSTLAKSCIHFAKPVEECVGKAVAEYIGRVMRRRGDLKNV